MEISLGALIGPVFLWHPVTHRQVLRRKQLWGNLNSRLDPYELCGNVCLPSVTDFPFPFFFFFTNSLFSFLFSEKLFFSNLFFDDFLETCSVELPDFDDLLGLTILGIDVGSKLEDLFMMVVGIVWNCNKKFILHINKYFESIIIQKNNQNFDSLIHKTLPTLRSINLLSIELKGIEMICSWTFTPLWTKTRAPNEDYFWVFTKLGKLPHGWKSDGLVTNIIQFSLTAWPYNKKLNTLALTVDWRKTPMKLKYRWYQIK